MGQINDQVLASIALDLGRDEQIPGADLQDIIVPVVGLERYRRKITVFQDTAAVLAAQTKVKWSFDFKGVVSHRVLLLELVNGDTGQAIIATAQVRIKDLTTHIIEPLNARIGAGRRDVSIGPQSIIGTTSGGRENFRPTEIWVPNGADFFVQVAADGATFSIAGNMVLRMWVEDAPPEESLVGAEPSEVTIA